VAPDPRNAQLPVTFPVRTPSMRPGALQQNQALKLQSWLPTPVFLVGTDDYSKQWMVRNRDFLARQKAAGIVIDADNLAAFRSIQQVGQGLPMAPSSAEDLARRLRLSVYPVLIRADGVIVQ
jgi:integrating conjugative element protein (TIGR03765 family)